MLLAKIKEKLFNRRNKVEIEDVEVNGEIPASIKALIESLGGTSIKLGDYIYNEETNKFECVEEIPEDYDGFLLSLNPNDNDNIAFGVWSGGAWVDRVVLGMSYLGIGSNDEVSISESYGINKLDFASLTHSFDELDQTLKQIVLDAITDGGNNGVACTQAQWSTIKSLLDKSLYINYNGYSMIKACSDGIGIYGFGFYNNVYGYTLHFHYSADESKLCAEFNEL